MKQKKIVFIVLSCVCAFNISACVGSNNIDNTIQREVKQVIDDIYQDNIPTDGKWYHVTVKPYIFFSTMLPIDMEKAKNLLPKQNIVISYAGVFVNFICAIIGGIIIGVTHIPNEYFIMGLWLFMTLHFAELVLNSFICKYGTEKMSLLKAIIMSAIIFGIIHIPNLVSWNR